MYMVYHILRIWSILILYCLTYVSHTLSYLYEMSIYILYTISYVLGCLTWQWHQLKQHQLHDLMCTGIRVSSWAPGTRTLTALTWTWLTRRTWTARARWWLVCPWSSIWKRSEIVAMTTSWLVPLSTAEIKLNSQKVSFVGLARRVDTKECSNLLRYLWQCFVCLFIGCKVCVWRKQNIFLLHVCSWTREIDVENIVKNNKGLENECQR